MYIVQLMFIAHLVSGASDPPFQTDNKLLELCIVAYMPKNQPLVVVTSPLAEGSSWSAMDALCRAKHPGYALAHSSKDLVYDARTLCPSDNIVPVRPEKVFKTMPLYGNNVMQFQATKETPKEESDTVYETLDWTTSESTAAANDTKFRCGVCQMVGRDDVLTQGVYPPHEISDYAYEIQLISTDPIEDIGHFANGSDLTNKLLADLAKALEISAKSLRWHGVTLNGDRKAVVHVYYEPENVNRNWFYYVHWNDKYLSHKIVDNFEITMIKINNECVLSNYALKNSRTSFPVTGDVDINFDAQKGTLTTRECVWDETAQIKTAVWTQGVDWLIVWGVCDLTPGEILHHLSKEGMQMYQEVKTLDLESAFLMQFALQTKVGKVLDIQTLVGLTNLLIVFHSRDTTKTTYFGLLTYSMPTIMAKAYISLLPQEDNNIQMHRSQYINVLVAAVEPANPVVGMAVTLATVDGHIVSNATQLHRADMSKSEVTSNIVVTVSESITLSANCIHVAMYGAHLDTPNDPPLDAAGTSWMTFVVVAFTRNVSKGARANDDFVDIAFKPAFREESQKGVCAEWKSETGEWYSGNCRILKSTRDAMVVCRCKNLVVSQDPASNAQTQNPGEELELTLGSYIIYGFDASLSTYLADHITLVVVIIFVGIMSLAGLLCVILTAVFFPEWRKDQGHKIFMHMIFALTVNLILGFVKNFISIDTRSIACIGIGVLRHYSFLAMFVWMMTLSGLQLKRLTTIAGAKGTSHLILKVSLFAWGMPLVPIVILLAWDTGFYKSEVSNRGYCYPEGAAFQATVQAPAGIILVANLVIFVFILNHIYGWVKCNNEMVVRKHAGNDRAEQLRRLCTTIFIFVLFGFTWVFHFLSEEGIINSEFLFEFLFLITASFHLFMLSLFFIALDKSTRTLWQNARFGCKIFSQ